MRSAIRSARRTTRTKPSAPSELPARTDFGVDSGDRDAENRVAAERSSRLLTKLREPLFEAKTAPTARRAKPEEEGDSAWKTLRRAVYRGSANLAEPQPARRTPAATPKLKMKKRERSRIKKPMMGNLGSCAFQQVAYQESPDSKMTAGLSLFHQLFPPVISTQPCRCHTQADRSAAPPVRRGT